MKTEKWQKALMTRGELFTVGGAVRDALIGEAHGSEEVDYLVRGIPPEELEAVLSKLGDVAFVGKSFGVYKFRPRGGRREIDIAYPRTEVSTGPGHRDFDVDWKWDLEIQVDLARRDFTMNAMAKNLADGTVIDPHGGAKDIQDRILRMVFPDAFREDPLRVLRGVRFAARFGLRIDPATYDAMVESSSLVGTLSLERVQDELNKLLVQCERPSEGLAMLHRMGLLSRLLPELERAHGVVQNEFHPDDVFWHSLKSCDAAPRSSLLVRWAALLHDLGKVEKKQVIDEGGERRVVFYGHETRGAEIAVEVLRRLRFSNDFIKRCARVVENHMFLYRAEWNRGTVRRFVRRVGEENLEDLLRLREADCLSRGMTGEIESIQSLRARIGEEIRDARALKIADLAIDGEDVKRALGMEEGPAVGRVLKEIFERVLDDPSLNKRERLLAILDGYRRRSDHPEGKRAREKQ
jgi:poly(A) polymerase/tRNA nucleotidyltransferase (CCA-adding enzyme)